MSLPVPLLEAIRVSKRLGTTQVLREVSLQLAPGERVALTGPSGAGKSTLLNCLGGIERPDEGDVRLGGVSLRGASPEQLAALRRKRVGTVFQFFHLLPTLSAFENIELPLLLTGVPESERVRRVSSLLDRIGLAQRASHRPAELSGGEQQRVALARAVAHSPELVLADEPTGALDSRHGAEVLQLLRELTEESGTALVLVTHSEEAAAICGRRLYMRDGALSTSRFEEGT